MKGALNGGVFGLAGASVSTAVAEALRAGNDCPCGGGSMKYTGLFLAVIKGLVLIACKPGGVHIRNHYYAE